MVRRLPWLRMLAESVTIVASILGALAIDAWWDRRQDLAAEQDVLASLESELAENLDSLTATIAAQEFRYEAAQQLFRAGPAGLAELDPEVVATVWAWADGPLYFTLVDDFQASIESSGQLTLIRSRDVRAALTGLSRLMERADRQRGQVDEAFDWMVERYLESPGAYSRIAGNVGEATPGFDLAAEMRLAFGDQGLVDVTLLRLGREEGYVRRLKAVRSHMEVLLGLISSERAP